MAKKKSKAAAAKSGAKKMTLGGFFRTLHQKPQMMDEFSSGPAGRKSVIEKSNLAPEHKKLLKDGCVPDIIRALAGVPATAKVADTTMVVNCCDTLTCNHPHCAAFSKAADIYVAKKAAAKKPAAKKKKK
jgi:hypothetical protein